VPSQQFCTELLSLSSCTAAPVRLLRMKPFRVEAPPVNSKPVEPVKRLPSMARIGVPVKPSCVSPSMTTGTWIAGMREVSWKV
jgi:hypothetical protein